MLRWVRLATGTELFESLRYLRRLVHDLGIAFMSGPGAHHIARGKQCHPPELHESPLAPCVRLRREEMPALPAVRPARPPAIKPPAFRALSLGIPPFSGLLAAIPSSSFCRGLFLFRSLMVGSFLSSRGPGRLGNRVDEFTFGHRCSVLDPDARGELDEFGLAVGLQTATGPIAPELARRVLGRGL